MHLLRVTTTFLLISTFSGSAWAFSPKAKTIGLNAVYGSVGGALLGVSSLAFGAKGRVVAKGASLGLYLGLAFGVYVVMTHGQGMYMNDGGGGGYSPGDGTSLYDEELFRPERDDYYVHPLKKGIGRENFYLPFFRYQF